MPNNCKYVIFDNIYKCCDKYLYTNRKSIKRHCGFTHEKFIKPKDKRKTKHILVCRSCKNNAECRYSVFNNEYKFCGKYLYTGKKSKKERHCGFTHQKYAKPKDKKMTKYILLCHSCKNKARENIQVKSMKHYEIKNIIPEPSKRSGVSCSVMESQGFGYQTGDPSFDALLMNSRGFGVYTGDPSFDDMLRRSRFG